MLKWPSKVTEGHWKWHGLKENIGRRLPINVSYQLRSYLAPFPKYSEILAKKCEFFLLRAFVPTEEFQLKFCNPR